MSTPRSELPPDQEGPGKTKADLASSEAPKAAENYNVGSGGIISVDADRSANAVDALREVLRSLKKPPGVGTTRGLCNDGVIRIMIWLPTPDDVPTRIGVYDARPLSPEMIKAYLDRKPWVQEVEDRFRGVDGRDVPQE
jgi:hypothetical protein